MRARGVDPVRTTRNLRRFTYGVAPLTAHFVGEAISAALPGVTHSVRVRTVSGVLNSAVINGGILRFDTVDHDSDGYALLAAPFDRLTIPAGLGGLYMLVGWSSGSGTQSTTLGMGVLVSGTQIVSETNQSLSGPASINYTLDNGAVEIGFLAEGATVQLRNNSVSAGTNAFTSVILTLVRIEPSGPAGQPGAGASPSATLPLVNGVAAVGVAATYTRGDHVHPVDTSRAPLASPVFTGDPQAPTPATADNDTSIATTAYVQAQGYATAASVSAGDSLRVLKAGDTMTGSLFLSPSPGAATLNLNKSSGAAGYSNLIQSFTASSQRWALNLGDNAAEAAGEVGSNFAVGRYSNAGALIDTPLTITRASGAVAVRGTQTNDNAAAGQVGEYISANQAFPGPGLTTATPANITSISLTAGDWDVAGIIGFNPAGTTTMTVLAGAVSSTSASASFGNPGTFAFVLPFYAGNGQQLPTGLARFSLAATTTIYLVAQASFAASTLSANGRIWARRVR